MVKPWDSYYLIEKNLRVLGELKANEKIGRADNAGVYQVHRDNEWGRKRQDSIKNLEGDLTEFLRYAIYAAHCATWGNCPFGAYLKFRIGYLRDNGLQNLKATYEKETTRGWLHRNNKKTDQIKVVDGLESFIRSQSDSLAIHKWICDTAKQAFSDVRLRYKETYKSSNKQYVEKVGGKFQPGGDPNALANRLAMNAAARAQVHKQRDVRDAEDTIMEFTVDEYRKKIADTKAKLNAYIKPEFNGKKGFDDLSVDVRQQTLKMVHSHLIPEHGDAFLEALEDLKEYERLLRKRQNIKLLDRWEDKGLNCGELSTLARMKLQVHPFVCVCKLSTRLGHVVKDHDGKDHQGEHQFTIFGLRLHGVDSFTRYEPRSRNVLITKSSRTQIKTAYVVDPWANVCCPVDEYPRQFKARMLSWSEKGKHIKTGGVWIDPGTAANDWYANTIDELDWLVGEYQAWGVGVFTR